MKTGSSAGRTKRKALKRGFLPLLAFILLGSCSFDYGDGLGGESDQPDIVMRDVEYVRVRDGKPQVRFSAEAADRFETRQTMELKNFSFEQFDSQGIDVNAKGSAGEASVALESGDITMREGVTLEVESEDLTILTPNLNWKDQERRLNSEEEDLVEIRRSDGTNFTGSGFSADARRRSWNFNSGARGSYYHEDEEEEEEE